TANTHRMRGELALAEDLSRKALYICAERGFPASEANHVVHMGLLLALRGQSQTGLEQILESLDVLRQRGSAPWWPSYTLALGYELAGKSLEASATLEQAMEEGRRIGEKFWGLAWMHELKGRLLEGESNSREAENSFRASIEVAR